MRTTILSLMLSLMLPTMVLAEARLPETDGLGAGLENLGSGLLDGLLDDLQMQLPANENPNGTAQKQAAPSQPSSTPSAMKPTQKSWLPQTEQLRRQMNQLMGGEDVGRQQSSPLTPIAERMRNAASLIANATNEERAQTVQKQVVTDLDALIKQLEKSCQCQCQGSSSPKSKPGEKQASKRSKPKPSQKPSKGKKPGQSSKQMAQNSAQSSSERMGSASVAPHDAASAEDLMKAAWGHLPARLREQMVQSSSDEFLPEYQEELEKYFKRLAEREASEASE